MRGNCFQHKVEIDINFNIRNLLGKKIGMSCWVILQESQIFQGVSDIRTIRKSKIYPQNFWMEE